MPVKEDYVATYKTRLVDIYTRGTLVDTFSGDLDFLLCASARTVVELTLMPYDINKAQDEF